MQSLGLPYLTLQNVELYGICPILSCSACYTPVHTSHLTDMINNHRIFWAFRAVSMYSSLGDKYLCCWYIWHYCTWHSYVNFT